MRRRVIIDTDPGVDDAVAIFMALASPELEVIGLTTVFGNAAIETTTRNALALLETAERTDLPVIRGERSPIASDYGGPVPHVHGFNGLGDAVLTEPTTDLARGPVHHFIHSAATADPGAVTLLALGPLTNLAIALQHHPDLPGLVEEVVVMGNALVPGNATPVAEANINNDPEAADLVFGAEWKVTMVGLDVTHGVNLTGSAISRIARVGSPSGSLLGAALPLYKAFYESTYGIDGIYVHDPSTVAYLLDPGAFTTNEWSVRVETESFSRGKTWPNLGNTDEPTPQPWEGRPAVRVCTAVDGRRVAELVEDRLTRRE